MTQAACACDACCQARCAAACCVCCQCRRVLQAPVQMVITAASNVTVLFNTDAAETADVGGGMVAHTYRKTPPMATYLIAIVAGDLVKRELLLPRSGDPGGAPLPVRVWGRRTAKESLSLAVHAAAAAVQGALRALPTMARAWHSSRTCVRLCTAVGVVRMRTHACNAFLMGMPAPPHGARVRAPPEVGQTGEARAHGRVG